MNYLKCSLVTGGLIALMMGLSGQAIAGTDEEQMKRMADPDQWPAPGRDFALTRHSNLADINTKNVSKLNMIWNQSTSALRGHEGQPLVIKDVGGKNVLFMISGCPGPMATTCNIVQALDLTDPDNPKQMWNYNKTDDRDASAIGRACCDTVNRGGSYAEGKFVYGTLDGYVIALDGQTGKEAWVVKHAFPEKGETITPAPLIADGKVIIGFGGDEFAARGRVTAYNLADGKVVWNCHSTGSDADVCLTPETNKAHPEYGGPVAGADGTDLGIKTFPESNDWKIGGGAAWGWYSYDPELKIVYYSTGNPGLWSPSYRCPDTANEKCQDGTHDNKWSMTIFARNVKDGSAVWAYQMTPFDQWDYDGINENILIDIDVDGKKHKALTHFDRNGFNYVIDRTDGTLLRATKYVTTNWAEKVDLKTGKPVKVLEHSPLEVDKLTQACPSAMGGKDQQPASVDPKEPSKLYVPTNNWCMELTPQKRDKIEQGTVYVFANVYMYPEKAGVTGKVKKYDVIAGTSDWEIADPYPNWSGTMNTDGGLMFYGSLGGDFRAVDRKDGKVLWHRKLGSGIIGNPITWKLGDHQYVGIFSGLGGWIGLPINLALDLNDKFGAIGASAMSKAANLDKIPQGGELNVFRVME
jgi:PQQ-dependent dehydrogenase (methanol/ethanol family)